MNIKQKLTTLLLLAVGAVTQLNAQTAVTAGSQVTGESSLEENVPYIIYQPRNSSYIKEATDRYSAFVSNSPDDTGVFYFIKVSDGVYKIKSHSTGKFISKPTAEGIAAIAPVEEASAGEWNLQFDTNGCIYPLCNGYGWNRGSNALWATAGVSTAYNEASNSGNVNLYKIYEVALSTTAPFSDFADKDISISASEAASISEGQWYVMKNRRNGYAFENSGSMKNQAAAPFGYATDNAKFLVRFLNAGDGKYYLQNGLGNFWGVVPQNTAVPATALGTEKYTIGKINSTDGHFYLTSETNGIVLDCQQNGNSVVGWNKTIPTTTGGNNDWAFYPVEFVKSLIPTISEVYTLVNNTSSNNGALIYNPENPKYVWSSSKNSTFDANNANCQWVFVPTGTAKQYYIYNVGVGKFAVPVTGGTYNGYCWAFSSDAVAVKLVKQVDGTYKIFSVTGEIIMSVSNNYIGPIINYNDAGGNFTITKVDVDASEAANAAVAKLIKNQKALTTAPTASGWYALQIKTAGNASYVNRYVKAADSEYNYNGTYYPLTFTGAVDIQPSIKDATFFTYIDVSSGNKWQMPNGKYLVNDNNKFPTSSTTANNITITYENSGIYFKGGSYYAVPYNDGQNYFIGETYQAAKYYNVYPIDLEAAGLVAWQVICDDATETTKIACTRNDVSGLTSVYKNGYIFLPTDVTPESSDFNLDGATNVTVDASAHTVTFAYDPNLAIVADGVIVEQGWQTAGRGGEVMLLRVNAAPFADATGATLNVSLLDGAESNISALTLYEASSDSPEILSASNTGAPTKTQVATTSVSGATATLSIGNLTTGAHYYWLGATVKSDATLGAVVDAAVTGITYTRNEVETTLDLTSVGDPADRGAMVFNAHSYPFLPWDNGSHVYRIPAMVVADDGSIVAAADKRYGSHTDIGDGHVIDIVVRRSTDGGKTWGSPVVVAKGDNSNDATCGYGDPTLLKLANGTLVCTSCVGNLGFGKGLVRFMVSKSADNGQSWSKPVDVVTAGTLTIKPSIGDFFITSGHGILTNDGVMMYLVVSKLNGANTNFVIYSTDEGEHWTIDDTVVYNSGDEAKLAQLNDGTLIASIRQGNGRGFNFGSYTKNDDGTLSFTWGEQSQNTQLHNGGAANNQDIFYYQREPATGKTDVIFHSMTTGNHANLKLYYSTDQGQNWTEFLNVQTKGTRYVTMDKSSAGSLYLLFEDQSLNAAGGTPDTNHYPINFLEITREQLEALIPTLNNIAISSEDLKIADGTNTNGPASYGDANSGGVASVTFKNTWTSNATSGTIGLTLSAAHAAFAEETSYSNYKCLGIKPSAGNATDVITITAPAGYIIKGYSLNAGYWTSSENYTLTASEGTGTLTCTTSAAPANSSANLEVTNIYKKSTSFTVKSNQATNTRCLMIKTFIVELTQEYPVKLNTVGSASYATLYLPFDVKTDANTKAYVIKAVGTDYASLTELEDGEIAANTAVALINETSDAAAFTVASGGLTQQVTEDANLLKGTLVSKSLDLSGESSFYSLGKLNGEIGFYKFSGGTITLGANKAYLEVPAGGSVKGFTFDFDDDATSIQNSKFKIQNEEAPIYNLAGQRLSKPVKGINIVGGRKVLK